MLNLFKKKTLEHILSTFERTVSDLESHLVTKAHEAALLIEQKIKAEEELIANSAEVQRVERVLAKVKELVS